MTTTLLTNIGLAEITNSFISGFNVNLTQIAIGDGEIVLSPDTTALVSEKWRGNLKSISLNPENPSQFVARINVPTTVGGFTAREIGLYDSENHLIAIGTLAAVELIAGQTSLTISMAVEVSAEHIGVINITSTGPWIHASEKAQPGGVATLGGDGKVPLLQLPDIGGSNPPKPIDLTPLMPDPALTPTAGAVAPVISGTTYSFVENNSDALVSADVALGESAGFWIAWQLDAMASLGGYVGLGFVDATLGAMEWRHEQGYGLRAFPGAGVIDSSFGSGAQAVICVRSDGSMSCQTSTMSAPVVIPSLVFSIGQITGLISPPKDVGSTPQATFVTDVTSLPQALQDFIQAENLPSYFGVPPVLPIDAAVGDVFYVTAAGRFNGVTYADPDEDGNCDGFIYAEAENFTALPLLNLMDCTETPSANHTSTLTATTDGVVGTASSVTLFDENAPDARFSFYARFDAVGSRVIFAPYPVAGVEQVWQFLVELRSDGIWAKTIDGDFYGDWYLFDGAATAGEVALFEVEHSAGDYTNFVYLTTAGTPRTKSNYGARGVLRLATATGVTPPVPSLSFSPTNDFGSGFTPDAGFPPLGMFTPASIVPLERGAASASGLQADADATITGSFTFMEPITLDVPDNNSWSATLDREKLQRTATAYPTQTIWWPGTQSKEVDISFPSDSGTLIVRQEVSSKYYVNFFGSGNFNGDRFINFGINNTFNSNSYYHQVHGDNNYSNAGYSRNVVMYGDYQQLGGNVVTGALLVGNRIGSYNASDVLVRGGHSEGNSFYARNNGEHAYIYRMKGNSNVMTGDAGPLRNNIACINRQLTLAWVSTGSPYEMLQQPNLTSPNVASSGIKFETETANGGTPFTVMCVKAVIHAMDISGNDHLVMTATCIARRGSTKSSTEIIGTPIYTREVETGDATNWIAEFVADASANGGKIDIGVGTNGTAKRIFWNADISIIQTHVFQN